MPTFACKYIPYRKDFFFKFLIDTRRKHNGNCSSERIYIWYILPSLSNKNVH